MRPVRHIAPASIDTDAHHLGVLDDTTCLRLLRAGTVGRLGFSVRSLPVILPVNYLLHDGAIVFRSEEGDKVRAARRGDVACFELDQFDGFEHSGWSVLATGRLALVPDPSPELAALPVAPWALQGATHLVLLTIELLSGRVARG